MLRPVSVLRPYDLIWSGDPALALAPIPTAPVRLPDETDDELEARTDAWKAECDAIRARNSEAYNRAIETGDWTPILKAGDAPTRFRVRQVPGSTWRVFWRLWEGLGVREQMLLAFRVGVIDIIDGPIGSKIELTEHLALDGKPTGLGLVLPLEVCDTLDRIGEAIINDLSLLILQQRGGPPGK